MKKILIVLMALLVSGSLAACGTTKDNQTSGSSQPQNQENEETAPEQPDDAEQTDEPQEPQPDDLPGGLPVVAGAARYRGTVTQIEQGEEGTVVHLQQPEGVDYGHATLQILLDEDTTTDFELADLEQGMHLDVFYGAPMGGGELEQPVKAIQAGRLADGSLTVFNGTILSMTSPEESETGEGMLEMKGMANDETVLFLYSDETQFYLDTDALAEGDALNIFYSGAMTRSLPPQAFALEVRLYASPDSIDG